MTTPIHNFQDILDAMERDPALRDALRSHILTEELIQLPAQFAEHKAQFAEFVQVTREHNELVDRRLERLETDMAELKTDMAELKTDMAELKTDVAELKTDVAELKTTSATMGGHVSRLIGADYESQAARLAPRRVRQHLEILNARVVHQPRPGSGNFMGNLVADATQDRRIDDPQADDLELTDLILTGTSAQGGAVYVLAEVSVTAQQDDVDDAKRRAGILRQATGVRTLPAVIGESITPEAADSAAQGDVAFMPVSQEQQQAGAPGNT
jgi:uncharacterized coiled-coil protein SlyX